ncbi:MAG: hypothetical protein OMM_06768 [Candidatus Magnetoglobus multicellularis str. Araruama]|uniref:Uncharacterized protein n=1 Tax=Candidatus Magnetoglobus multicellularis str. Araruama TaxID=890399 RepID=A0A1V1PGB7_9BACT|nr:MAG: hypothetical protein OMM_06768 [Candidatus Magnetoglobus multicellularis str. Araruama]
MPGNLKLLCANDLSEDPHNLWIKLFASTRQAKLSALETLLRNYKHKLTKELSKIIIKVISFWTKEGEYTMEQLMEDTARRNVDQDIVDFVKYFNFSPKDVFEMFPMKPEEIFQANPMKPEEIFRANPMKPEEIFNAYPDQKKLHQAIETYYMSKIKQ